MKKGLFTLILLIGAAYLMVTSKPIQDELWRIASFLDPQLSKKISGEYQNKSNEYLLSKIHSKSDIQSATAAEILIARKDKSLLPDFIKLLKSKDQGIVGFAIEAIGKIGDTKAIPYLVKYINEGSSHAQYINALMALSEMKYEPIIPEIIKLAKQSKEVLYRQSAIEMMDKFDRPEFIAILEEMTHEDNSEIVRDDASKVLIKLKEADVKR